MRDKVQEADWMQHLSMHSPDGTLQLRLNPAVAFMEGWLDVDLCFWMGKPVVLCNHHTPSVISTPSHMECNNATQLPRETW